MTEHININSPVEMAPISSIEDVYEQIEALRPHPVNMFVPMDGKEQKQLFLSGQIDNPRHTYDRLDGLNIEDNCAKIQALSGMIPQFVEPGSPEYSEYEDFANKYLLMYDLLAAARDSHLPDEEVAYAAGVRFMELNTILYGEPDETTYRSLLDSTLKEIDEKDLSDSLRIVKLELDEILPEHQSGDRRYEPSPEAIAKMKEIAEYLYGGMFRHIPENVESFGPEEVAEIFWRIIAEEFGEVADGWRVVVCKANSINVDVNEKLIRIPEDRKAISKSELRGLIAHEIGVHKLGFITGGETNMPLLRRGLNGYSDAEEGLGKVMEQATKGQYAESGVNYYTVAGLMHFDQKDFRESHDIMWRLKLLQDSETDGEISEEDVAKAKESAYKTVMRITRGTDKSPWFKDLAYYNGAAKMWKYCESACDDPEQFMFLLMGKKDITNPSHRRIVYESKSVHPPGEEETESWFPADAV